MSKALVVGAGIGGLAAAVALHRAGWHVEVVERARTPGELGFALLLAPNAATALRRLGLLERVAANGVLVERAEIREADGTVLRRFDLRSVHEKLGAPTFAVLRTALHGTLLDAVEPSALRLGRRAVGFEATARGVTLQLEDGSVCSGDILIGADGVGSVVRAKLHPAEPPARSNGFVALRGLGRVGEELAPDRVSALHYGNGFEAGIARVGPSEVYWFLGGRMPHVPDLRGVEPRVLFAPLREKLHASFRQMIDDTADADLRLDALLEREPLERWGAGCVTLLGDAAHPMLPHAGQGAAQALEDAVVLAESLGAASSAEDGLRSYERARIPRTTRIVHLALRNARIGVLEGALASALRNAAIRWVPERFILKAQIDLGRA